MQWTGLGYRLGEAYQVADDLRDAYGRADLLGKPIGQDAVNARPSAVHELGMTGAIARMRALCDESQDRLPACDGRHELRAYLRHWSAQLLPQLHPSTQALGAAS
jgi:geranylgeranyl diphosphate synthase type II